MIKSMTGFASLTRDDELATITVTVKAVNHRFLDLQLRVPASLAASETRIRSLVQNRVSRGRVEVSVSIQQRRTAAVEVELNEPFLDALKLALERARERGYVEGRIGASDLLRFPQALSIREKAEDAEGLEDPSPLAGRVEEAIAAALEELDTMRVREGGYLKADLDARRVRLGELFGQVAAAAEQGITGLQTRLLERVRELRAEALADEALVAQEIAKFVGRSDITEEVVRFRGHLEHWQALTESPEPCGRKLDFLLQEMNREVNTAGSKAEGPAVSEVIVVAQGRPREDARAGPECRVGSPIGAACCSSSPPRPAPGRRPWSSGLCRSRRIWPCRAPTRRAASGREKPTESTIISLPAHDSRPWSRRTPFSSGRTSSGTCTGHLPTMPSASWPRDATWCW